MVKIIHTLPEGYEQQAASLYWEAFGSKLGKLLGPAERGTAFFAQTLNHRAILAAFEGETLLGIAAYQQGKQGFSSAGLADLWRHYGAGALWRLVPLALLERTPPENTLQMDGICVTAKARGKGVGTALFAALFSLAREQGHSAITLDVINTNPRARALYESLGFVAISEERTSFLRPLLGFDSATRMQKRL